MYIVLISQRHNGHDCAVMDLYSSSVEIGQKITKHLTTLSRLLEGYSSIVRFRPVWIHQHHL